jgi:ribonuclease HII
VSRTPKTLGALRQRYLKPGARVPTDVLASLESDEREGAKALLKAIKERARKNRSEGQRLRHMLNFENELWESGIIHIAGVDEAGMAPLAGPICAAAAILPRGYKLVGLDDSKKILDEDKRDELAFAVKRDAICWAVGWASVEELDTINIYHAGLLAMRRAVEGLSIPPQHLLVDARKVPGVTMPQRGIIHGDALSLSIAAASVIAKTTRDALMREMDAKYPGYGFKEHKGYPVPDHQEALQRLGATPIHRRSFAAVKKALGLLPEQEELFAEEEAEAEAVEPVRKVAGTRRSR